MAHKKDTKAEKDWITRYLAGGEKIERDRRIQEQQRTQNLIERDGDGCFVCGMGRSKDHAITYLSPSDGDVPGNKVLCCKDCEEKLAAMTMFEKIDLIVKERIEQYKEDGFEDFYD